MSRFCKTCRHLRADRKTLTAECHFWVEFSKSFQKPALGVGTPVFKPTILFPRHVWDDLETHPVMAALGRDNGKDPWSETMDCPQWKGGAE